MRETWTCTIRHKKLESVANSLRHSFDVIILDTACKSLSFNSGVKYHIVNINNWVKMMKSRSICAKKKFFKGNVMVFWFFFWSSSKINIIFEFPCTIYFSSLYVILAFNLTQSIAIQLIFTHLNRTRPCYICFIVTHN